MGEVYRARDTRLDRTVALKIIRGGDSVDALSRERFYREARAISALDHPHICALYDVGDAEGTDYLVMQFLEGETLHQRLARARAGPDVASSGSKGSINGPLSLELTLRYAIEIASSLDVAHRRGIVHRDLKPANIIITRTGTKLLDFGLAKLTHSDGARETVLSRLGNRSTSTAPLTSAESIVGTLNYMPPEQLEGRAVDARTDIFAFGAVLFEMLSGRRAFDAASNVGVIAAILSEEPPELTEVSKVLATLPPFLQRSLERLVRKCLAKSPDDRWQCAGDLSAELHWINDERLRALEHVELETAPQTELLPRRTRDLRWVAAVAVAILTTGGITAWMFIKAVPPPEMVTFEIAENTNGIEAFADSPGLLAVSPDGRRIAIATGGATAGKLVLRSLDAMGIAVLEGTEGAWHPFWSPDGKFLGFTRRATDRTLRMVNLANGGISTVADDVSGRGAWGSGNTIIFNRQRQGLFMVTAPGGTPTAITKVDAAAGEADHLWPVFLPDGRRFLYLVLNQDRQKSAIVLDSLDAPGRREILKAQSSFELSAGQLLVQNDGTIYAHPFDSDSGTITGEPRPVASGVAYNARSGRAAFSVSSAGGTLSYLRGGATEQPILQWFDLTGKPLATVNVAEGAVRVHSVSPDGSHIAVQLEGATGTGDIRVIDVARNVATRLTSESGDQRDPVWSPDGKYIYFASSRNGDMDLYRRSAGGGGADELLFQSKELKSPSSVSPDGRYLLFARWVRGQPSDIWALPLAGDRQPFPLVRTGYNEGGAALSPDGKWLAYHSNDLGTNQVYVESFPSSQQRERISTTSGAGAAWSRDGKTVFYLTTDGKVMAADVMVVAGRLRAGTPRELFTPARLRAGERTLGFAATAGRFLLMTVGTVAGHGPMTVTVLLNWQRLLSPRN
jgi:Tol biopolymer transport system component/tRNA A-37 threonylcarbamoyl transferase component Bud32